MLFSEKVTIALIPVDGSQPWYFKDIEFKAGTKYEFSPDTVDWQWYQGDAIAVLDGNGKVKLSWRLQLKEYRPGECPSCHGTKKCPACRGNGYANVSQIDKIFDGSLQSMQCRQCAGTGTCQTCDIPYRPTRFGGAPTGLKPF